MKAGLLFIVSVTLLCAAESTVPAGRPFGVSEERARRDAIKRAKQGIEDPVLVESAPVIIPPDWKLPAIGGKVVVTLYIKADGTVTDAEITSISHPMFIRPVLNAVMKNRYVPAKKDGKPVEYVLSTMVTIPPPAASSDKSKS